MLLKKWCRLAAKEKDESFDSPFFFIYEVSDLEFVAINQQGTIPC